MMTETGAQPPQQPPSGQPPAPYSPPFVPPVTAAPVTPVAPPPAAAPPPVAAAPPPLAVPAPAVGAPPLAGYANNSGTGGPAPEEIKGWNWGAFFLNWIWGVGNGVWLSLLVFVLSGIWQIVLGVKGSEWAWQNRRWESVEQFKETQRVWAMWGWIVFAISFVLGIIAGIIGGVMGAMAAKGGTH
jgi:hypothetical protein